MMKKLKALFAPKQEKKDFSSFFNHASPEEKRKVLEGVIRKANQDQRDLVKQYEQANQKPA
ncbi:MAG: hypothetical protein WC794_01225 [Candidatus Doudnabacteria bacterium]|jgi:hypothetical protein